MLVIGVLMAAGAVLIASVILIFICCDKEQQNNQNQEVQVTHEYDMKLFGPEENENENFPPPPPADPGMVPAGIQFTSGDFPSVTAQVTSTYEFNE